MKSSSLAAVSFVEVGFELNAFVGIRKGLINLSSLEVSGRAVRVKDLVARVELDGFRVRFNGFRPLAILKSGVSFVFKLKILSGDSNVRSKVAGGRRAEAKTVGLSTKILKDSDSRITTLSSTVIRAVPYLKSSATNHLRSWHPTWLNLFVWLRFVGIVTRTLAVHEAINGHWTHERIRAGAFDFGIRWPGFSC